jgi:hypothetical protein
MSLPDRTSMIETEQEAWVYSLFTTEFSVEDDCFTITVETDVQLADSVLRRPPVELLTAPEIPWRPIATGRALARASALCLLACFFLAVIGAVL